ncbi:MAG: complex I subunit 1 family protein [bacterium]|nr:complex I subunit 1 family protein [bacterium]
MIWFILIVKVLIVFQIALGLASVCVWVERKGSALIQDRIGANRAGAFFYTDNIFLKPVFIVVRLLGVLGVINTLLCDAVKALFKEDFVPKGTSNFIHSLAPFMGVFPVFLAFSLIPFAPDFVIAGITIRPQVASLNAGVLFIFAMASMAVYGATIAGWCGNNKFSLLGGLRSAAQMISYELALGISLVAMVVLYGTLDLYDMVVAQTKLVGGFLPAWGVFTQPVAFIIFFVAGMAETKRAPFDLPESESELVAGYFTEYSGMKFLLFWLGEFAEIALLAALMVLMFFGGWDIPYVTLPATWVGALIGHLVFMGKITFFCVLQIVIRWTLPRFRYDQLMHLGWKILLPLSMANLIVTAVLKLAF